MTATPLPTPVRREPAEPAHAIEAQHKYGQCLTQWCPKMGVTGKFRRCIYCGACQFC